MNLKNFKKKFKLIKFIFSHRDIKSISDEQRMRGIIISELGRGLKIDNVEHHIQIQNITDSIVSKIMGQNSFEENFKHTIDGSFHQNMWFFSAVAGYVTLWELQVKLLAEHLGIEIKETPQKRSKHHKKNRIMSNRDLNHIISDINKKLHKNFDLDLVNLNGLRSSLIHANFDQLRILANNYKHNYKKEHQGNVFVFSLEKPEAGTNLSKNLPQETREQQGLFSWFLEVTNSHLLKEVLHIFDKSLLQINCIVDFSAYSFDERRAIFEQVVFQGQKLTTEMMQSYEEVIKTLPYKTVEAYFARIRDLFGTIVFAENIVIKTDK